MHYLIRLLVPGDNAKDALGEARDFADLLCDSEYGGDFDWNDFDGRWGTSKAHRLSTKVGQKDLNDALKLNRTQFDRAMAHVRFMLENYTDDKIYNDDFGTSDEQRELLKDNKEVSYLTRWQFARIGLPGETNDCYLYGKDWTRIENSRDLQNFLRDADMTKMWIVNVDFHN